MSKASSVVSDEISRKRMRKGTHSCTECRRRKKSCIMHQNGVKCTECTERGVECVGQDVEAKPVKQPRVESKQGLQERIVKLESTVQAITARLNMRDSPTDSSNDIIHQLRHATAPSSPTSDETETQDAENLQSAPVLSLFDNAILSRRDVASERSQQRNDRVLKSAPRLDQKTARIRETLLSLFPPPELEEQIMKSSHWWRPWRDLFPYIFGDSASFRDFVLESKTSDNVQMIAKALLGLSLTVQEGKGFDDYLRTHETTTSLWNHSDLKCRRSLDRCLKIVDDLILSDDELASTIDGIECIIMQAKHDSNNGRIKRSWIYLRRGLFFAQLLGLHRRTKNCPPQEAQRRQSVWRMLYQGDRYMSLLLGLPYGAAKRHCEMGATPIGDGNSFNLRLADIIGEVIDRNLNPSADGNYMETVKIEGSMMDLANTMPPEWWHDEFPRGEEVHPAMYQRLLPQFWYHQVRALLHLPFMLKANRDRRYEYNRIAALESARGMILIYQVLRPAQGLQSLICKIIDFQVFTAAMLMVLNLLGSLASHTQRNEEDDNRDWDLIISTNDLLQHASKATGGVVASQAARALGMFVQARNAECQGPCEGTHKVVIPYFGTVVFGAGKDFAKRQAPTRTPSAFSQSAGLPTPEDSYSGSLCETTPSASDPFISFDSYLAQMPFDFSLGGQTMQQLPADLNAYNDAFSNVNLDLDQDWAWYPADQQNLPPVQ